MEFISVKDRLPEPNIEVKIKWKDGSESYAYLCSVCKNEFMDSITGSPLADFPIMWQPLPPEQTNFNYHLPFYNIMKKTEKKMKKVYMNTFEDDLDARLINVERNWLRRPMAIILLIPLSIVMTGLHIIEFFHGLFYVSLYQNWLKKLWYQTLPDDDYDDWRDQE